MLHTRDNSSREINIIIFGWVMSLNGKLPAKMGLGNWILDLLGPRNEVQLRIIDSEKKGTCLYY